MRITSGDIVPGVVAPAWGLGSLIVITALLLLIALLDHATGRLPLQHLYYLPIIFAATRFRRGGLLAALAAVALYHLANPRLLHLQHGEADVVQIALFIT